MASKPGYVEIYPEIYQIPGIQRSAHAYLVKGRRKNVLIDTGLPTTTDHLLNCLSDLGLHQRDIHMVLLTHEHIDHAGGAPIFNGSALLAAHRLAANKLALKDEFALMNRVFDQGVDDFEIDVLLQEGASINLGNYELEILHTPGHCSGGISIYEPNHRLLFSGDTIMANGIIGGVLGSGNASDYIHTLKCLSTLKIAHLYPGHGRLSTTAEADILVGIERLQNLLDDSKQLFDAIKHTSHGFDHITRSLRDLNCK
ncbi:MAG: MBL fold metallo-hydrolase [Rhodocyclaceae bacterium]|nr:MBL fold metallo-hydrolase [Rhodocyclaceae bacterium]MDZ4214865.1 MBL fold metallo-hydrolase [Rhodocyclaceae bacterium]